MDDDDDSLKHLAYPPPIPKRLLEANVPYLIVGVVYDTIIAPYN